MYDVPQKSPKGILTWVPMETPIGTLLYLDLTHCYMDSLRAMSYISQSESFAFKPGRGAVGRCFRLKADLKVEIKKNTRFDEFHRAGVAIENGISTVSLCYYEGVVKEYLNDTPHDDLLRIYAPLGSLTLEGSAFC